MTRRPTAAAMLGGMLLGVATLLAACAGEPTAEAPRIEDETFALEPATVPVRVGVLAGQLTGLSVARRVNAQTGETVYAPQLRGTLELQNTSTDQAVRLVGGQVDYLDAAGARIAMPADRADTSLSLYSYAGDRLDPGKEVTHSVAVPFPTAALHGDMLAEIRLSVTYLPMPYRQESVAVPVAVVAHG